MFILMKLMEEYVCRSSVKWVVEICQIMISSAQEQYFCSEWTRI